MEFIPLRQWGFSFPDQGPIIISGPCSAETEEQVRLSCRGAAQQGAAILRAGIWKPRTRPDSFEGVGSIGLPWIKAAGRANGLPVTVEVANSRHVEAALQHNIDILWVGARTTVNPFTVQEIANALQGQDIPVLIKNPVNPDLDLWIGAIERFHRAGLRKLAVIHRGFSVTRSAPYRNQPLWELPIELRRRYPQLEIICDPSHIAGRRDLLRPLSQKALDLAFDGLMIESHINPEVALSDAQQQVTPEALGKLLRSLIQRQPVNDNPDFIANLEALRVDIDSLDQEVIQLLAKRMEVVQEIGKYKRQNGVTILQMNRWARLFDQRVKATMSAGLSGQFAQDLIQSIHNESIRQQEKVMNQDESKLNA
ncbi:MAG: chorismate mutase [Bacteroidota bacterium]